MCAEHPQLKKLRRQYFALYPLHQLRLPDPLILAKNQVFLKAHILEDPELGRYQPEAGYRKTFWRRIISGLEDGLRELIDEGNDEAVRYRSKPDLDIAYMSGGG